MPELPEVETMCRGIRSIVGRKISRVLRPKCTYRPISIQPSLRTIRSRIENARVEKVSRLGKRVLIHAAEHALVFQPKMTGLVALDDVPDNTHVRLSMQFAGTPAIELRFWDRRGLGTVELIHESEIEQRIVTGKLGPDALSISPAEFYRRLSKTTRPIKVVVLDQKVLAGVGNLYASEMLHAARIHPEKRSNELSRSKTRRLHEHMQRILLEAIAHEGSTLSDGTYRNALNDPGSYQNCHLVYDRAEEDCPSCAQGVVQRIVQSQRSTFFCPACQR